MAAPSPLPTTIDKTGRYEQVATGPPLSEDQGRFPTRLRNSSAGRFPLALVAVALLGGLGVAFVALSQHAGHSCPTRTSRGVCIRKRPLLHFNEKGIFKIMQLADLHLGEAEDLDWGPRNDNKTFALIRKIVPMEKPDLIVLTGDQLTGNNVDENATEYYRILGDLLEEFQTPYAMIFGNHDDAPLEIETENGTIQTVEAKTDRKTLVLVDQKHPHSLTEAGPSFVFGVSNYMLHVYNPLQDTIRLQLVLMDSGGGSYPQHVEDSQLQWFHLERIPGVSGATFLHIPTPNPFFEFETDRCAGFNGDHGFAPMERDDGLFSLLQQDHHMHVLAVGHNHGNSYCCSANHSLHVCFGRHSGYGGYGDWDRGGRIYEFTLNESQHPTWKSWVRMESGEVVDDYSPTTD